MHLLAYAIAASIFTIVFSSSGRRPETLSDLALPRDGEGIIIRDAQGRVVGTLERGGARDVGREAARAARAARFQRVFKDR